MKESLRHYGRSLWEHVHRHATAPRHPGGLAAFRVFYGIVVLGEVVQLIEMQRFIFYPTGLPGELDTNPMTGLAIWAVAAVALTLGAWTRAAVLANLICAQIFISDFATFEYHHDYAMIGMATLLLLVPVEKAWSVDAWWQQRKEKGDPTRSDGRVVRQIHHDLLVFFGIALVYFDSVFFKLLSPMWREGLGVWMPASLPYAAALDFSWLLDMGWLIVGLGYLTLFLESVFIGAMWWKKLHVPLFVVGIGLHIGISLTLPIPWFGLGVAALYLLLLPDGLWARIAPRSVPESSAEELPLQRAGRVGWLLALMAVGLCTQCYLIGARTDFGQIFQPMKMGEVHLRFRESNPGPWMVFWLETAHRFFGVTDHPVFMDHHFQNYTHLYALRLQGYAGQKGVEPVWIGPVDPRGRPVDENQGRMWVYFTFRFNGPGDRGELLLPQAVRYSRFWALRRGLALDGDLTFDILRRPVGTPTGWQKGWLQSQQNQPWSRVGSLVWDDWDAKIHGAEPPPKTP